MSMPTPQHIAGDSASLPPSYFENSARDIENLQIVLKAVGKDSALADAGYRALDPLVIALLLAKAGIPTIPSRVLTKIPCQSRWPERATTVGKKIIRANAYFGYPNCSLVTGRKSGIVVLDVDGKEGESELDRLQRELGLLPDTAHVISGRVGGGSHIWLRCPPGTVEARNQQPLPDCSKVDLRAWHGHVVIPGSKHKSGAYYQWAPGYAPDEIGIAECPAAWWEWLPKKGEDGPVRSRVRPTGQRAPSEKAEHNSNSNAIGDGPGEGGFNRPIRVLCCQFYCRYGVDADALDFKEALKEEIRNANASAHSPDQVERYASDEYLTAELISARKYIMEVAVHG